MCELYPYFTNDGSVGLYSTKDQDVYHSTYGAVTESWQKFVEPSTLKQLIDAKTDIKILDICYGIGYNTKAAIQFYLNETNILKFKNKRLFFKKNFLKNNQKFKKNIYATDPSIAPIGTDKISREAIQKKISSDEKNEINNTHNNVAIYTNNITVSKRNLNNSLIDPEYRINSCETCDNELFNIPKLIIDAVELDSTLINLSPFIQNKICNRSYNNFNNEKLGSNEKIAKLNKISKVKVPLLKNDYKILNIILMFIIKNLIDSDHDLSNNENINKLLNDKKFKPFFAKSMLNFASFYQNERYKSNQKLNKSTFLHNIYYRYVSRSYKLLEKLTNFGLIRLNLYANDARRFVLSSNTKYNIIFLDAFTPSVCPSLWTVDFFKRLHDRLEDDGMILTYSNSAAVRNSFILSGFKLGKIYDKNLNKFVGTVAVKNETLIEHPLDKTDIAIIHSKAGIPYYDINLNSDNTQIIKNREIEFEHSELPSSTEVMKRIKNELKI